MKTGTVSIDINEYDKMIETIRTSNEKYNEICEVLYKYCAEAGNAGKDNEVINLMTNAGYTVKMTTSYGELLFGKGSKIIKIGMK